MSRSRLFVRSRDIHTPAPLHSRPPRRLPHCNALDSKFPRKRRLHPAVPTKDKHSGCQLASSMPSDYASRLSGTIRTLSVSQSALHCESEVLEDASRIDSDIERDCDRHSRKGLWGDREARSSQVRAAKTRFSDSAFPSTFTDFHGDYSLSLSLAFFINPVHSPNSQLLPPVAVRPPR